MKRLGILILCLTLGAQAWALTRTGMPALDELREDVERNGPLSKRLAFTEEQRERIKDYIDDQSEELVKKRDASVKAENKLERKEAKKADKTKARENVAESSKDLAEAREEIFSGLQDLMDETQYDALKKWRAKGKAKAD